MNEFILLLWAADIVYQMKIVGLSVGILLMAFLVVGQAVGEFGFEIYKQHLKKTMLTAVLLVLVILLPSPTTIHKYAALNATKDIAETQIGKKALAALEVKFDDIIEGDRDE